MERRVPVLRDSVNNVCGLSVLLVPFKTISCQCFGSSRSVSLRMVDLLFVPYNCGYLRVLYGTPLDILLRLLQGYDIQ
jgi:hypothetical protein